MDINRPYRISKSRRTRATKVGEKESKLHILLIQVGVCLAIFVAAVIFKVAGGSYYNLLRQEYIKLSNQKITVNSFTAALDQLSEKYNLETLEKLSGGIKYAWNSFSDGDSGQDEDNLQDTESESTQSKTDETGSDDSLQENSSEPQQASDPGQSGTGGKDETFADIEDDVRYPPLGASFAPVFITAKIMPPVKGRTTSKFGYRIHPITEQFGFHKGLDIAAPAGTPIACAYGGRVKECGLSNVYGNYIIVEHSPGVESFYGHCSEIIAPQGAVVRQGETIAKVGSTGVSTGPHLHFEIRIKGICYDPDWLLDGKVDV